jgi:hypothetical protein
MTGANYKDGNALRKADEVLLYIGHTITGNSCRTYSGNAASTPGFYTTKGFGRKTPMYREYWEI